MIKNLFSFGKKEETVSENPSEKEFQELTQGLTNFSSLVKKSSNKNLILKDYDILDLRIIEFLNKHGRNSSQGKNAVELSRQLSDYYSFFKDNIHLYLDEPISQIKKEPPKIDLDQVYTDLRKRLNSFKESVNQEKLTEDEIENFILLFNDEIKELFKHSDKDFKFKFIELKNKLVSFYKQLQKKDEEELTRINHEANLTYANSVLDSFKAKALELKNLINLERKTEQQIIAINNKVFEIKERYLEAKEIYDEKFSSKEKESFLKILNSAYNEVDSLYISYIEKIASLEEEKSKKIALPDKQFSFPVLEILKTFKPNPILKLRENKEKVRKRQQEKIEETIRILTEVLGSVELYEAEELKQIFTNNFQVYEKFILSTDYSLLVKSLLDDLEDNISKLDEEKKLRTKRDAIAKDSYTLLKQINSNLSNYSVEELQILFEKNLENYKAYSKYTIFGLKINALLNNLNSYITTVSNRKSIQEDLSRVFLSKLDSAAANFENYSITFLENVFSKSMDEYSKYYKTSKFSRNIEFSLQNISNTLSLLKILVSFIEKDLDITENQRLLLRDLIYTTYSQFFSFGSSFIFNLSSKRSLKKLEKVFNLEIERKLMLEDVNNKIISLNLSNNAYIKLLINNLINAKKHQSNEDLKQTFLELSNKISKNDKITLNEAIVKLMDLTNSVLPLRKKSLLELKTKLI
ncbi:MAG: hypothetical protein AABW58_00490 [Nanoarchaeota archaeon]